MRGGVRRGRSGRRSILGNRGDVEDRGGSEGRRALGRLGSLAPLDHTSLLGETGDGSRRGHFLEYGCGGPHSAGEEAVVVGAMNGVDLRRRQGRGGDDSG